VIPKEPNSVDGECRRPRGGPDVSTPKRAEIAPSGFLRRSFSEEGGPAPGMWYGQVRMGEAGILREGSLERVESSIARERE
jgi:hypothetical protein